MLPQLALTANENACMPDTFAPGVMAFLTNDAALKRISEMASCGVKRFVPHR